jgi:hypothetical protein
MVVSLPFLMRGLLPLFLLAALPASSKELPALTADAIIQKAVDRADCSRAGKPCPAYTYTKVNVTEELDGKGKIKERKERVFQVNFSGGATSVKLVEVNGHAPAQADVKFQAHTQSDVHQFFGQPTSGGDNHDAFLTSEIAARFEFALVNQCTLAGRQTYQISFQPKNPEPPVHAVVDRVLDRISGTLWIDAEEFEIARADVQLGSEVDFLGGVIGCLRKLAYSMTRVRLAEGVWLHSVSSGDFEGRKLFEPMRIKIRSECSDFRLMAAAK